MLMLILFFILINANSVALADDTRITDREALIEPAMRHHIIGTLTINHVREGQLFGMHGTVGKGIYRSVDQQGRDCSIAVSLAVGRFSMQAIDSKASKAIIIAVADPRLNDALLAGKRTTHDDWRLSEDLAKEDVDGYLMSGLTADDHFILHSRHPWLNWLLDERAQVTCL